MSAVFPQNCFEFEECIDGSGFVSFQPNNSARHNNHISSFTEVSSPYFILKMKILVDQIWKKDFTYTIWVSEHLLRYNTLMLDSDDHHKLGNWVWSKPMSVFVTIGVVVGEGGSTNYYV